MQANGRGVDDPLAGEATRAADQQPTGVGMVAPMHSILDKQQTEVSEPSLSSAVTVTVTYHHVRPSSSSCRNKRADRVSSQTFEASGSVTASVLNSIE